MASTLVISKIAAMSRMHLIADSYRPASAARSAAEPAGDILTLIWPWPMFPNPFQPCATCCARATYPTGPGYFSTTPSWPTNGSVSGTIRPLPRVQNDAGSDETIIVSRLSLTFSGTADLAVKGEKIGQFGERLSAWLVALS